MICECSNCEKYARGCQHLAFNIVEDKRICHYCGTWLGVIPKQPPADAVEEKIKDLADLLYWSMNNTSYEDGHKRIMAKARELVSLARKQVL